VGQATCYLPRWPDQVEEGLRHKLVYVVVVAVLDARADASGPQSPHPIADPALAEGGNTRRGRAVRAISGVECVREIEVLNPVGKKSSIGINVERLRELRRERVLSLRELEERSGVSYNTIWRIEDARQGAHPRTVRKLAEALGMQPFELIRES
jgi:DNA-binding Xre family transcriptional regulator